MNPEPLPNKNSELVISTVNTGVKKILVTQLTIIVLTALVFFYYHNLFAVQSALFGGMVAMLNVWLAERTLQAASKMAQTASGSEVNLLYIGVILRFVSTLILFVLGIFVFKLMPLALVSAFAAAQLAYLFKSIE